MQFTTMEKNTNETREDGAVSLQKLASFFANHGSQRQISIRVKRKGERERYGSSNPIYEANWWPGVSLNAVVFFFRYHYTKGADAAAASRCSVTLREATTAKTLRLIYPPTSNRIEPEQSSLYRRHTKPFESWEPFSFVLLRCPHLCARRFLCLSLGAQLFSQLGISSRKQYARPFACAREAMHRSSPKFRATVHSRLSSETWRRRYREA